MVRMRRQWLNEREQLGRALDLLAEAIADRVLEHARDLLVALRILVVQRRGCDDQACVHDLEVDVQSFEPRPNLVLDGGVPLAHAITTR
jgi:hypothetical protein